MDKTFKEIFNAYLKGEVTEGIFLLLISILILLNSCAAINIPTSSVKEKCINVVISAGMIDVSINKEFLNHNINMFIKVEIEVVVVRVFITRIIKNPNH